MCWKGGWSCDGEVRRSCVGSENGHVMGREDGNVLGRTLDIEVKGQTKIGRLKKRWKTQAAKMMKAGLSMENEL